MRITIDADVVEAYRVTQLVPKHLKREADVFIDRVGYKLEAESKREAPVISGNLRRSIIYIERGHQLEAHANYSKYVHGPPFYKNKMRRKETPFITNAISNADSFIKAEARALLKRVLK